MRSSGLKRCALYVRPSMSHSAGFSPASRRRSAVTGSASAPGAGASTAAHAAASAPDSKLQGLRSRMPAARTLRPRLARRYSSGKTAASRNFFMFVISARPTAMVLHGGRARASPPASAQGADEAADRADASLVQDAQGLGADDGDVRFAAQEVDVALLAHAEPHGERQRGRGAAAREVTLERLRELRRGAGDALARDAVDEASGVVGEVAQARIGRVR